MAIEIMLTEVGKKWFKEHYPQGIIWEYNPDMPFELKAIGADFTEVIDQMGIPYRLPNQVDGWITWTKRGTSDA